MHTETAQASPARWKRLALGALSALLLVPMPVFATYSLGNWTVNQPNPVNWSANNSSGFNLSITPKSGQDLGATPLEIDFTAPVTFTSTSNSVTANTANFSALNVNAFNNSPTAGLTITIGFLKSDMTTLDQTIFTNNNQFVNPNNPVPFSLATGSVPVDNTAAFALVRFVFSPRVTWQASSTITVSFTPGN
jgi:hypothetical protein